MVLLVVDLVGTFAFALNGALTAIRTVRVDIVGVLVLGLVTATGGGIVRDVLLGRLPPSTFTDWRYLATAAAGSLIAFLIGRRLERLSGAIDLFDAIGLSFFAVNGALTALAAGAGPLQATLLGVVTAVGGGTIRDVMIGQVPTVLSSGLYAVPAAVASGGAVGLMSAGLGAWPFLTVAAAACFAFRMVGLRRGWGAPVPRGHDIGGGSPETATKKHDPMSERP
ncbi:trimeric intracellular cation channel family protein [Frondihabitans sp. PAMC 28766]|uniref:trimeric intracellular cation channel family protein n=1 Tax=Frondihabitans sp. PAMC 28766 TaxID=1795630 RepID=UPI001EF4433C|nr:trimeric intracellular cation channel family protein [Frondihabitans sp. PAMC 28766]